MKLVVVIKKYIYIIFLVCLFSILFYYGDKSLDIHQDMYKEPTQSLTKNQQYINNISGIEYDIEPIGDIALRGIITSIDAKDTIDSHSVVNVCLIWGDNIDLYLNKQITTWYDKGRCLVKVDGKSKKAFKVSSFSNNHILLSDQLLKNIARRLVTGDQIIVKGKLINMKSTNSLEWMKSSTVRDDIGDGACEIIMAKEIKILS